jgi:hypothetical protein
VILALPTGDLNTKGLSSVRAPPMAVMSGALPTLTVS